MQWLCVNKVWVGMWWTWHGLLIWRNHFLPLWRGIGDLPPDKQIPEWGASMRSSHNIHNILKVLHSIYKGFLCIFFVLLIKNHCKKDFAGNSLKEKRAHWWHGENMDKVRCCVELPYWNATTRVQVHLKSAMKETLMSIWATKMDLKYYRSFLHQT